MHTSNSEFAQTVSLAQLLHDSMLPREESCAVEEYDGLYCWADLIAANVVMSPAQKQKLGELIGEEFPEDGEFSDWNLQQAGVITTRRQVERMDANAIGRMR